MRQFHSASFIVFVPEKQNIKKYFTNFEYGKCDYKVVIYDYTHYKIGNLSFCHPDKWRGTIRMRNPLWRRQTLILIKLFVAEKKLISRKNNWCRRLLLTSCRRRRVESDWKTFWYLTAAAALLHQHQMINPFFIFKSKIIICTTN